MVKVEGKGLATKLFATAAAAALSLSLAAGVSSSAYADEVTDEVDGYIAGGAPWHIQYTGQSEYEWVSANVYDNADWEAADDAEKQAPSCFTVKSSDESIAKVAVVSGESVPNGYDPEDTFLRITPVKSGTVTITVTYKYKDIVLTEETETEIVAGAWEQAGNQWKYKFGESDYVAADPDSTSYRNGSLEIRGKLYFFDANGIMRTGWYCDQPEETGEPEWYYLGSDGAAREGWQLVKNKWYYLYPNSGVMVAADIWTDADGYTWGFNASGALTSGWFNNNLIWNSVEKKYVDYYTYSDGTKDYIRPTWYYLGGNGSAQVGWNKIKGSWYYLGTWSSPSMRIGKFTDNTGTDYVADYNGAMKTGWYNKNWSFDDETGKYATTYTATDENGAEVTLYREPVWYYANKSGALQSGWNKIQGKWYYLDELNNGKALAIGYFTDCDGEDYVADYDGAMKTGWYNKNWRFDSKTGKYTNRDTEGKKLDSQWYYGSNSGALKYGWNKIDGQWYLFGNYDDVRVMLTGWQQVDGSWYYLVSSGEMVANKWVGDYFLTKSGAMATNTWIGNYHVNASGVWDATK